MADVFIALGLGGLAFWAFTWVRTQAADKDLDARFQAAYREARMKLPPEDFEQLDAQLIELRSAVIQAARVEGWNGKRTTREGKAAGIQSINGFIEIHRVFTPKAEAA